TASIWPHSPQTVATRVGSCAWPHRVHSIWVTNFIAASRAPLPLDGSSPESDDRVARDEDEQDHRRHCPEDGHGHPEPQLLLTVRNQVNSTTHGGFSIWPHRRPPSWH